jgi:hypothetical protein
VIAQGKGVVPHCEEFVRYALGVRVLEEVSQLFLLDASVGLD